MQLGALSIYHPHMQEGLVAAAQHSGAEVWRGAQVRGIERDGMPSILVQIDHHEMRLQARLVVAADGRTSMARQWAGFSARRDPENLFIAGVLLDAMDVPLDTFYIWRDLQRARTALLFPQGQQRARAYFAYSAEARIRLSGDSDLQRFVEQSLRVPNRMID
jgi:2-polyprenyl-6-methoxyphenol hydroxylase-like FAD-dependent oxidoreductase